MPKGSKTMRRRHWSSKRQFKRGRKLSKREIGEVKRLMNRGKELKYYQSPLAAYNMSFAGGIYDLSLVPQGDTDSTRDGDRLELVGAKISLTLEVASTTAGSYNNIGVFLFQWKPVSSSLVNANQIVDSTYLGTIYAPMAAWTHDTRQSIKKIMYRHVHLESSCTGTTRTLTLTIPGRKLNKQCQYYTGTTTGTNHIFLLLLSDDGATPYPSVQISSRIFYYDS